MDQSQDKFVCPKGHPPWALELNYIAVPNESQDGATSKLVSRCLICRTERETAEECARMADRFGDERVGKLIRYEFGLEEKP